MGTISLPSRPAASAWVSQLKSWWSLIKDLQTGLLVLTGAAAYATGCCTHPHSGSLAGLAGSLLCAISGCTIFNMVFDRDIDAKMQRTAARPLPQGRIRPADALAVATLLSLTGVAWAFSLGPLYGAVVLTGLILDAFVYTRWLKRRTPFAIIIGGLSGGVPALAGRTLAVGTLDGIGWLLLAGVLLWIPTHIMTLTIKYTGDYAKAGIPTFPAVFGVAQTRRFVAIATMLAAGCFWGVGRWVGLEQPYAWVITGLGVLLVGMALYALIQPSRRSNFFLFKSASLYMVGVMLCLILGGL